MRSTVQLGRCCFPVLTAVLCVTASAAQPADAPRRTVYAWFPADLNDWDTKALDWAALDYLSIRCVVLQPDGTVKPGWGCTPERIKAVTDQAHQHGVKVTILAWGTTRENSSTYLAKHAETTAQALLDFVRTHDLDGVCLDDETWSKDNTATGGPNRDLVTGFLKVLHAKFKAARPDYHLSWASPPVIAATDKFGASWTDYRAAAEYLDAFAIMAYCMVPPTAGWTGSLQPVEGGGKVGTHPRDYATLLQDYIDATGGKKEKLLLGVATGRGGTEWRCRSDQPLASIYPLIEKPRRLTDAEARANAAKHGRRFEPRQKSPWYCYKDGDHFVQGWYEDDESLAAKFDLAKTAGVGGVALWVLDGAKEPPETFQLLREHVRSK